MKNKLLHRISASMTDMGINIIEDNSAKFKVWKSIITGVSLIFVDISLVMVSITNRDDFNTLVTPAPYIAAASVLFSGLYVTYRYRNSVRKLLYLLDTNLYIYPDEHMIQIDYHWYLLDENINIFIRYIFYCQVFFLAMISLPALGELVYYQRISTLVYPTWTPWKMDDVRVQLSTHLLEVGQAFGGLWFNQIVVTFELIVIICLIKQYLRLNAAIGSLEIRTSWFISQHKLDEKEYHRVMRENILHCIRHQQLIHKSYYLFKIWFEAFFSLELAICLTTFALALYVAMNASNLPQIWNFFTALAFIWSSFLTRCVISEIFTHFNGRLSRTIFWEVDLQRLDKMNKRLLLMFHQNISGKLSGLYGLSVFEANRTTLSKIIRSTYSVFNVLKFSRN